MQNNINREPNISASAKRLRSRNVYLTRVFLTIIAIAFAFAAGFYARGSEAVLDALGLSQLATTNVQTATSSQTTEIGSLASRVNEVESIINTSSMDTYDLDTATSKVLGTLSDATGDSYMRYFTNSQYVSMNKDASITGGGIGVMFSEYQGQAYAIDVFEDSPAQAAGVAANDVVVAVNGDRSHSWTVAEVTALLRQDEGSEVVITWRRGASLEDTTGKEFTTTLACTSQSEQNVTSYIIQGEEDDEKKIGYIQLKQVTQNCSDLVRSAVSSLEAQGAQGYILDLRNNPGGYLTQAVNISSLFVKSGVIVRVQTKIGGEVAKNATGSVATEKPLVVLVNSNTTASAEIIAAAVRDNERGTVVGEKTIGKGSVQVTTELTFGGAFRYTAATYTSPKGYLIDGLGISPDITVNSASNPDSDNQLQVAVDTVKSKVA